MNLCNLKVKKTKVGNGSWMMNNYGPDCHVQLCSSGRHQKADDK